MNSTKQCWINLNIPSYWIDIDNDADWQAYVDGMYSLGLEDWAATQGIEEIAK